MSLGYQGDADVLTDMTKGGQIVYGVPWKQIPARPLSVRDATRLVASRHLADLPLAPRERTRREASIAEAIRRAYYRDAANRRSFLVDQ